MSQYLYKGEHFINEYDAYWDKENEIVHWTGANPGTPYTLCGLDAGLMHRLEWSFAWTNKWCIDCLNIETANVDALAA